MQPVPLVPSNPQGPAHRPRLLRVLLAVQSQTPPQRADRAPVAGAREDPPRPGLAHTSSPQGRTSLPQVTPRDSPRHRGMRLKPDPGHHVSFPSCVFSFSHSAAPPPRSIFVSGSAHRERHSDPGIQKSGWGLCGEVPGADT